METETIIFRYKYAENYSPIYINGAFGNLTSQNEVLINFFLERPSLPDYHKVEFDEDGTAKAILEVEPVDIDSTLVRHIQTGIVMDLNTATSLHQWLTNQLQKAGILAPEGNFGEDDVE